MIEHSDNLFPKIACNRPVKKERISIAIYGDWWEPFKMHDFCFPNIYKNASDSVEDRSSFSLRGWLPWTTNLNKGPNECYTSSLIYSIGVLSVINFPRSWSWSNADNIQLLFLCLYVPKKQR